MTLSSAPRISLNRGKGEDLQRPNHFRRRSRLAARCNIRLVLCGSIQSDEMLANTIWKEDRVQVRLYREVS